MYQMGQVEESMTHFYEALALMQSNLPKTLIGGSIALLYQSVKQFVHFKFPSTIIPNLHTNEPFLDKARCLAHISHAYKLQHRNVMSLMTVLKRLNDAEQALEYHVHEVKCIVAIAMFERHTY